MSFDLEAVRHCFPSLAQTDDGKRRIYFDNPAGTQVPQTVVDAMSACLLQANANLGGGFASSIAADKVVENARLAMADFLNAANSNEIVFGQNMTTLTLQLSRSIGRTLSAGDEIILTRMEHDANVWPWVLLAKDLNLNIRWLPFNLSTFEFDLDELEGLIGKRTKLICIGAASNLTGTINDVQTVCQKARNAGVMSFVDAVQSAPHLPTDVQAIGGDFLTCSAYKFFGPHQGILWGNAECLQELAHYKLRPVPGESPWCFETGTQSHEGMAGVAAAVDYFAWIGDSMAGEYSTAGSGLSGRRQHVCAAMQLLFDYEKSLSARLIDGLLEIDGIRIQGIASADAMDRRVPTVSFTHAEIAPDVIASALAEENVFVWSGHNYALEPAAALGLLESGGVVRIGPVHYNSLAEVDETLDLLRQIVKDRP